MKIQDHIPQEYKPITTPTPGGLDGIETIGGLNFRDIRTKWFSGRDRTWNYSQFQVIYSKYYDLPSIFTVW